MMSQKEQLEQSKQLGLSGSNQSNSNSGEEEREERQIKIENTPFYLSWIESEKGDGYRITFGKYILDWKIFETYEEAIRHLKGEGFWEIIIAITGIAAIEINKN